MEDAIRHAIFQDKTLQNQFDLHGYIVVDFLSKNEVKALAQAYDPKDFGNPQGFYSTSFSLNEQVKEKLHTLVDELVQSKAANIFNSFTSLGSCYLSKAPGELGEMPIHQDWTVIDESRYDSITMWVPLQDVNSNNGAMQVIPGSHRFSNALRSPSLPNPLSNIQEELRSDLIEVPLNAGQAIIFSQALIHASPANKSEKNRLAVTYGLIPEEAQLLFYHGVETEIEKHHVPVEFFQQYNNRKIGERPHMGTLQETFPLSCTPLSSAEYRQAKLAYKIRNMQTYKMIPLFKNKESQAFFEENGYLVLPLLDQVEIDELTAYYNELGLKDKQGYGFHVSMDDLSAEQNKAVRQKVWDVILPKMDQYLINYKAFVASFVVKETNAKGVVPAHQDWSFVDKEEEGYCSITCWTTLVDTTLDNGCMGVIKQSHKMMQNHRPSPSPQTPVPLSEHMFSVFPYLTTLEMKAGEVLFFDNRTFHASPPNTTDGTRLAAGVGITQKDAQLVHYHLNPDGNKNTLLKYKIDEDFFIHYNNARLAKMYDNKEEIPDYELMEELPYLFDNYTSEELVDRIKAGGNSFNVPMCEKLSVLFGYDMTGQKKEAENQDVPADNKGKHATSAEHEASFFEVYTPMNILREIKYRLTGKV